MSGAADMSTPVTRGEVREALEIWGGELLARIEASEPRLTAQLMARIESSEQRLTERIDSAEQRLLAELGRHQGEPRGDDGSDLGYR